MAIAPTLQRYLDQHVSYEVIPHEPTLSSMRTAQACHISGKRLAKAVVLRRNGGYMLAVVPASHHVRLSDLSEQLGEDVDLAAEGEIERLFGDCARGAGDHGAPNAMRARTTTSSTTSARRRRATITMAVSRESAT